MKEINIAELLKYCPKGTKLYSPLCGECVFDRLYMGTIICKKQNTQEITFTSEGYYMLPVFDNCECMIFPSKDQRDWSKFQIPFKDGDVVITTSNAICIYKSIHQAYKSKNFIDFYCVYRSSDNQLVIKDNYDSHWGLFQKRNLQPKKEAEKLFQAIKANGYKWNPQEKTLEKLCPFNA